MSDNAGKTVEEILRGKKGSIKQAPLRRGSPSWDELLEMTWEEVDKRSRERRTGYQTIRKLLTDPEYDK